nr:hypothetical protein [uncultured bacterium]
MQTCLIGNKEKFILHCPCPKKYFVLLPEFKLRLKPLLLLNSLSFSFNNLI